MQTGAHFQYPYYALGQSDGRRNAAPDFYTFRKIKNNRKEIQYRNKRITQEEIYCCHPGASKTGNKNYCLSVEFQFFLTEHSNLYEHSES